MALAAARRGAISPSTPQPQDHYRGAWNEDAAWMAQLVTLDAVAQAAQVRRRASALTATISETAERDAEQIRHRASVQAAVIRETAEREAAALRAAVVALSPAPVASDGGAVSTVKQDPRPDRALATKPGVRRSTAAKSRQARAMRKAMAALVVLSLAGVATGVTEIGLHGFSFFLFRSAGTGAGNLGNLNENQGPGQPDAPGPHQHAVHPVHR